MTVSTTALLRRFEDLSRDDVDYAGGKGANLGERLATSICSQAPSVQREYAQLLVEAGIDAISVNIDAVDRARRLIVAAERRILLEAARRER
jgi:phosphoenolpyruvate synthase/pyruvate phosphate dikinase